MPPIAPPTSTTLAKKLSEVMGLVGRIPKDGFNQHFKYAFVKEADLVEKISQLLSERNVCISYKTKGIEIIELTKRIALLRVECTFHDGDTGETLTMEGLGEIEQEGGKGIYKAQTGAIKFLIMKGFLVATGDDPEDDHGFTPQTPAKPARTARPTAPRKPAPKMATPEQIEQIKALAGDLGKDIEKDVLAPLARQMVVEKLTFDALPEILAEKVIQSLQKRLTERTEVKN